MSIINGTAKSKSLGGYEISQSLRFDDDSSSYLSWTPSSVGNRKTWTFSTWVKRTKTGGDYILGAKNGTSTSNETSIGFRNDAIRIISSDGSTPDFVLDTSALYRDLSAWYSIIVKVDTTQATSTNRVKLYVNGEEQILTGSYPAQNLDFKGLNETVEHKLGSVNYVGGTGYYDYYLAETHFIDGQALTPDNFGEFDETYGHWKPIAYEGTYGTNGFYLPYKQDYAVEGFSTTLYTGNGGTQYVGGVGFEPDLVWLKRRNVSGSHTLIDGIRGDTKWLETDGTGSEQTFANNNFSSENDGFFVDYNGGYNNVNQSSTTYVAWSWDMGDSTVENTDGSITSQVRANPTYGQSIVSYTGNGTDGATVGHGLSSAPEMVIVKERTFADHWMIYNASVGNTKFLQFNTDAAVLEHVCVWYNTCPTNTTITLGNPATDVKSRMW